MTSAPRESGGLLRRASLRTKLIALSTLLTAASVGVAFVVLSVSIRRNTRELLARTLGQQQSTLSELQQRRLEDLLRTSSLLTEDPTLRAAIETYREEGGSEGPRQDLFKTIQNETDRIAAALGADLLVVSDREGHALASSGAPGFDARAGRDLAASAFVRRVVGDDAWSVDRSFAVLDLGGSSYRVGCVPILLQGYAIGALALGAKVDARFVGEMRQSLGSEVVIGAGDRVVASTLPGARVPAVADGAAPVVVGIGGEEYVVVAVPLGPDAAGGSTSLYLLRSLDRALDGTAREFLEILLLCGACAAVVAWAGAAWAAGTVLRPLARFVEFIRESAASGGSPRRYEGRAGCVEVDALRSTYDRLAESLLEHERRLVERGREDLERLERLKETEKLAALGRMLSSAAHEINNPLTGVIGNVELASKDAELPAEVRARLDRAAAEARRAATLVKSLLKVSHRETGERAAVDLGALVRETVEMRRRDFANAGIGLEVDTDKGTFRVAGSELELQQVVLNVVNNAFDVLEGTDGEPSLAIRLVRERGRVEIVFEDNGPGMKNPKQVFEPFYTTKPVGRGTGLGLSICHTVAEAHGGEIRAENRPEGGARFVLSLPQAPAGAEFARERGAATEVVLGRIEAEVLLVDDEPELVDLQRELLESLGVAVDAVATGAAAISRLEERTYDLVVTDLTMPGRVSGRDLYSWAASHRPTAAKRFLFVSGIPEGDAGRQFVDSVGAPFLAKPFSTEEYLRAVVEAYRASR